MLPYGKQTIGPDDIQAVVDVLQSDWLTTGPMVERFENAFTDFVQSYSSVAVSNGTAALHSAMHAIDVGPGDEVLVPALTFCATSNAVLYQQGTPVFVDIDPETLLIDVGDARKKITPNTKAIVAVDYAGQPCDYHALRAIADEFDLFLISDSCHSLGGEYHGKPCGSLADLSCFSLHPVKPITAGEGGVVTVNMTDPMSNESITQRLRRFRNHGIDTHHRDRQRQGRYDYDMLEMGFNYRITDLQCALALSQLNQLSDFAIQRQKVADRYQELFSKNESFSPLKQIEDTKHANHLFVIRCDTKNGIDRDEVFHGLRKNYVGANVHYRPVYQHPYYRERFDTSEICCPNAEQAFQEILSLPIFPSITDFQVELVASTLKHLCETRLIAA